MKEEIAKIRHEYSQQALSKQDVLSNPVEQFEKWFQEALNSDLKDANAMTLATTSSNGLPSARILLLKDFDQDGFCFFTNYESQKALDIKENPNGALVFFWPELERQIRIEGGIEKVSEEESDRYFEMRPVGSRIAACISPQSKEIENRKFLEDAFASYGQKSQLNIPRPTFWGGYRLRPSMIEFWQGRENRLNDRIEYRLEGDRWKIRRLAP
ncbi:MAG: pyridoxamine 5'-phosphate oxidase [Marinifilaceae bacterium]